MSLLTTLVSFAGAVVQWVSQEGPVQLGSLSLQNREERQSRVNFNRVVSFYCSLQTFKTFFENHISQQKKGKCDNIPGHILVRQSFHKSTLGGRKATWHLKKGRNSQNFTATAEILFLMNQCRK